ncbi:Ceramide-1-phosphate transfer protein [Gracilariopsis chorda]|uniref:Ceramide-1-phosphate transfer protein n=1 Tax=Gracilariopsis chorda TaxID=448386 RepID=A0A2V3IKG0_9FLOR|nr:Ceramide-1-phosphate transfer protein [Gracilariopsis chorda]|eukprot:PXF42551.1 Ceramide-1-phosphate transfer protein [Gracilariopsis chorda]
MDFFRSRASYALGTATSESHSSASKFDFEKMTKAFEVVEHQFRTTTNPLPTTAHFIAAMQQLCHLFDTLGSAFHFVKKDIDQKLTSLKHYAAHNPLEYAHIHNAIQYELKEGTVTSRNAQLHNDFSFTRTLSRLMWALKFTDHLLGGLAQAFAKDSPLSPADRTLRWAVARAYDDALAPHHSWTIRKTVKGACLLLPSKEAFMSKIGVKEEQHEHYLHRLGQSMTPLVQRMYAYYAQLELLNLP